MTLKDETKGLSKNVSNQLYYIPQKQRPQKYFVFTLHSIYFTRDKMMDICAVLKSFIAAQVLEFILITFYN